MPDITEQIKHWTGEFGKEYTDRNALSAEELDALYERDFGITRTKLNDIFLGRLDRSIRILEVGSNVGSQLLLLQQSKFSRLYGIEPQSYAVELSKSRTKNINIIDGTVFDIPFKDAYFDLVFTSGLLIHINPSDIASAMREIHRSTKTYIWGFEYYADDFTEVPYRGHKNLLWKGNYAEQYLRLFPDLKLIKEKRLRYADTDNTNSMFLLRKSSSGAHQGT
jgi:pseudaminic acid biosynthesis-associated methylase